MSITGLKRSSLVYSNLTNNIKYGIPPPPRTQKTITAVDNAQLSTAGPKFGTASGLFDGNGDYLRLFDFNDYTYLDSDFTIEWWAYFDILPSSQTIGGGNYMVAYFAQTSASIPGSAIEPYILIRNNAIEWGIPLSTTGAVYGTFDFGSSVSINTWYHYAVVRKGSNYYAFRDGIKHTTTTGTLPDVTSRWIKPQINIGAFPQTGRGFWQGKMDGFRVSWGARYSENFTPPIAEFINDPATMLLLNFNGTNGSTTFTDSIS